MTSRRNGYGRVQLAAFLGLEVSQFSRARQAGLIPCPDRPRNRWSVQAAGTALAHMEEIRRAVGSVPDVGAVRAAEVLSAQLGAVVTGDGVAELARRGLIPVTGDFRAWPLTTKETIRAHRAQMRSTCPGLRLLSKATGGSSGVPLQFDLCTGSDERRTAATYRGYNWAGGGPGT